MKIVIKHWRQRYSPPAILNNLIHKKWKDLSLKGSKSESKEEQLQYLKNNSLHQPVKKPTDNQQFCYIKNISHC